MKSLFGKLILLSIFCSFFTSCETGPLVLPAHSGQTGEVCVVMEKALWDGEVGKTVRDMFSEPYLLIPQYEPSYTVYELVPDEFNKLWKPYRNVVVLEVADRIDTQKPNVDIYRNRYSNGQIFIEGKAKTQADLAKVLKERSREFLSVLKTEEIRRHQTYFSKNFNQRIHDYGLNNHQLSLKVPKGFDLIQQKDDFYAAMAIYQKEKDGHKHKIHQGIYVYTYPYVDENTFSVKYLLAKRDSIMKANVTGEVEGSFLTTQYEFHPRYEEIAFKDGFTAEIRGLWRIEGDFMGGPFYSLTTYDEKRKRIVTVEGYAYAPYFDKREYIREMEAVVKTLEFPK